MTLAAPESATVKSGWLKRCLALGGVALFVTALAITWKVTPLRHYLTPHHIAPLFEQLHSSVWAIPGVIAAYVLGGLVFFPLTILIVATAIAFPPLEAFPLALAGAFTSASFGYLLGRLLGAKFLRYLSRGVATKVSDYAKRGGVLGVAIIRMMPIAPLGVVDFSFGSARIPFIPYLLGTMLGLLPGITALTLLGHTLGRLIHERTWESLSYVALMAAAYAGLIAMTHYVVRRWQAKIDQPQETEA